jgi:hypothetical protein
MKDDLFRSIGFSRRKRNRTKQPKQNWSNQKFEPTLKTPVDSVNANSSAAHF